MIDVKELRSGNYVMGKPISIPRMGVHGNGITRITSYGIHYLEQGVGHYDPIPLTPEILEKCGFNRNDWTDRGSPIYYGWELNGVLLDSEYSLDGHDFEPIKYLHQLQNLYFALTGNELAITL